MKPRASRRRSQLPQIRRNSLGAGSFGAVGSMARTRSHTRRTARSNPRGRIDLRRGGYGFVQTAEGEFYIPRKATRGAFPDDIVEIAPVKRSGDKRRSSGADAKDKRSARVVRVVERAHDEVVGYFRHAEPFGVVEPVDPRIRHDIFTQLSENPGIPDGAVVRVVITTFPDRNTAATGHVVEVLGDEDDERIAVDLIVARHKLETSFSQASLEQVSRAQVDVPGALAEGYRDLRDRFIFTVDPRDARDFDDAVSLSECDLPHGGRGWRVGVHIADVSHYVEWGSPVDVEARRRATSVYLVDRVVPMLPERLSDDICSLRPHEDRRTFTVDMLVDGAGEVRGVEAYPAIICSSERLTYEQAGDLMATGEGELADTLRGLSEVAKVRARRREAAGGLDFDTTEAKVQLGPDGYPLGIELREKTDATELIEEAMIMCNEAVACLLRDAGFPCLYRVHEQPGRDALSGLVPVLSEFGWFSRIDEALLCAGNPHEVQKVLTQAKGRPEGALVATLVLRSMKRALYSPQLSGHYGLASEAYAHFTSPIRRYPDLVVHRMLKAALLGRPGKFDQEASSLAFIAEHSSEMERVAERAARESQEAKIVELMERRVGETFSALVSGVTNFGLFVRLDNTAEGVVEMQDLGAEYFILDSVRHTLTGADTGKQYRLGRRLAVRLVEADRRTRQLRFRLA